MPYETRKKTSVIVIHASATRAAADIGAAEIRGWHKAKGWQDIGYALVIRRSGVIEIGRPIDAVGSHVQGRNHDTVGVCLVGGLSPTGKAENNFTDSQWLSLRVVVKMLCLTYPQAQVLGHRDLFPDLNKDGVIDHRDWLKSCPCFSVREWLKAESA